MIAMEDSLHDFPYQWPCFQSQPAVLTSFAVVALSGILSVVVATGERGVGVLA